MTNPTRSITPTSREVVILILSLLLSAVVGLPTALAQMSTTSSSSPSDSSFSDVAPSTGIVIAVLFAAFFFMGFLSFYSLYCNPEHSEESLREQQRQLKPGLDQEAINSFPIFRYSDVKDIEIGKKGPLECAVCIAEFENDDALRLLPKCDHVFHPECIDAWLASHSTCPVCRSNLSPSQNELGQVTEPTQSDGSQNQSRVETQISVDVQEGGNGGGAQRVSENLPKRKLPRSHSTGHSLLSQPGENLERYTLRLPVEYLRREMTGRPGGGLKRTISCLKVVLPAEGSSSNRWVFSRTPPFLSRARFVASPTAVGLEGDLTAVGVGGSSRF